MEADASVQEIAKTLMSRREELERIVRRILTGEDGGPDERIGDQAHE